MAGEKIKTKFTKLAFHTSNDGIVTFLPTMKTNQNMKM